MTEIRGIVCDFGGVLSTPLMDAFVAVQERSGLTLEEIGGALLRAGEAAGGVSPLFELEKGRITEAEFVARLERALAELRGGEPVSLQEFSDHWWEGLRPNPPMIELMATLRGRGYRMAMLTNNVREWEPRWRAMLPVDEIFELIVDSAFVGHRKPEPEIYALTLDRFGLPPEHCLFVDDVEVNCTAAREAGMHAVQFHTNAQAIADIEARLTASSASPAASTPAD